MVLQREMPVQNQNGLFFMHLHCPGCNYIDVCYGRQASVTNSKNVVPDPIPSSSLIPPVPRLQFRASDAIRVSSSARPPSDVTPGIVEL